VVWLASLAAAAEPRCDQAAVDALTTALAAAPAAGRARLVAERWGSLCEVDAWHDVTAEVAQLGDPVRVHLVELQLAVGRAHVLPDLCEDPAPALVWSQATKMSDTQGRAFLYERCRTHRLGFYTEAEFAAAPAGWLSLFAWGQLRAGGLTAIQARPLVRAVAGL
jgi:hypothetical protein